LIKRTVGPDISIAAAGGVGDDRSELGTDALDIQEAILKVRSHDGVLVLMDMGSAILSAETAKELVSIEMTDPLVLCSAPLVEGSIAAAVQIQIGSALDEVTAAAQQGLTPKQEQLDDTAPEPEPVHTDEEVLVPGKGTELAVTIRNEHGLHLRPAANLIKALAPFKATVQMENLSANRGPVAAKSLVDLARLQVRQGDQVRFRIGGPDQEAAISAINGLVHTNFGDNAAPAAKVPPRVVPTTDEPFPVSGGIAIGRPLFLEQLEPSIPSYAVPDEPAAAVEFEKLQEALNRAEKAFTGRFERLQATLDPETLAILEAQRLILTDQTIIAEVQTRIHDQHENAAQAWHTVLTDLAAEQEAVSDEYLRARAADFREIRSLVVSELREDKEKLVLPNNGANAILVCDELTPSLADTIGSTGIQGVLQLHGGATSHGAILARALRLPSIGGAASAGDQIRHAAYIAFDGEKGTLWIDPSPELRTTIEASQAASRSAFEAALSQSREPATTKDGLLVNIAANAGSREDVASASGYGADSIGLFRSEFLFQRFDQLPSEEKQLSAYQDALTPFGSRLVTLRLLDIGGDKPLPFLTVPHEANPFLGVRGIRLLFQNPEFCRSHLRAVLRLTVDHQIRILVPMVTDRAELVQLRELFEELHQELISEKLPHKWPAPIGAMIETPSAAILADQIAAECDFLSFGTNDLTQYVLCAERGNPALNLYADALHPAVLRICRPVIEAAQNRRISVSVCGEIGSDLEAVPILLGLGLRDLSVTAAAVPNVKALVRELDVSQIATRLRETFDTFGTAADVREFGKTFL
ncbi:MAG: phosphoenolpyruvate--protein phosphotransferase, partial [Verrucomicrobia bacterium]|nr:phosphoenolpyruvate--protein phosphotransferase [Verrucomicrobiota bacterium]